MRASRAQQLSLDQALIHSLEVEHYSVRKLSLLTPAYVEPILINLAQYLHSNLHAKQIINFR